MIERQYSARNTGFQGIQLLSEIARDLPKASSLGYSLAERNIKARYRQSLAGIFWAFLLPVVTSLVWIILNRQGVVEFDRVSVPYPVFVITGTMLWQVFSNSVLFPLRSVQSNTNILTKINFPREALFFNALYEIGFYSLFNLVVIVVAVLSFGIGIRIESLFFMAGVLILIVLGIALSLMILPVAALYSDINFALPSLLQFAMYLTPVIYPQHTFSGITRILDLNPVAPVLSITRGWLVGMNTLDSVWPVFAIGLGALVLLVFGLILQRIAMEILIERMGS